ncbi:MAG: DUF2971 domain-containing protein [Bacteroidales bacterium]|nr:DUF2971 domain-containing protein [Bacteroidales bacterium]
MSTKRLFDVNIQNVNLPKNLYKYREWTDVNHRKTLTHNELYMAEPNSFKDDFDCKIPIRYDLLTDEEKFDFIMSLVKKNFPLLNTNEQEKLANQKIEEDLLSDKNRIKVFNDNFFKDLNNSIGVLCLTYSPNNLNMWNNYTQNGNGFCVGFHSKLLISKKNCFAGGMPVSYYHELPIIKPNFSIEEKYFTQIYSKLKKWEYENEFRLAKLNIQSRQVFLDNEVYSEVILGYNLSSESIEEITSIVKNKFKNVQIKKSILKNQEVLIENL